ncbi:serine hydrolase domain-containing protein [Neolewinella lacunae]|uniref:Beta-lactamase family protein n=1 Tax=Neolewinella lacunae TaxID=1517758 RepID=A0A923PQG3_9BACT|nr:serine hydrolase domain-containing protein [Neolewinella lacunae]MBC6994867.1 beta-lactamase family protein [Neolewinella lacunae]MDN3636787.1 serine hydrolase domain-containing protein [Neolewinella lacunae]
MHRLLTVIFFTLVFLPAARAQFTPDRPENQGFDPVRLQRVDAFLQGLVDDGVIPNAQTFVARRGKIVHRGTYGFSNLEQRTPSLPDDIYRIASQTKALVTVGLMMEYEKGRFLLEDPVAKYIPAFANVRVVKDFDATTKEYTTVPAQRPVTILDLLTHTAGIPYDLPFEGREELKVPFFASLEDESLEAVVNRIAARPLLHQPGEKFTYGLGIDVAGRVLEVVSGENLNDYLQRHLFAPLGMNDSHFYLPAAKHGRLVSLYSKLTADGPLTLHENATYRDFATRGAQRYYSGGAGSVGTIDDYAAFCQMLLNGGTFQGKRLLSAKTVDFMMRNQIGEAEVWTREDKFGLGFQVITPESRYGDQATPGSVTWGGMYCSEYTIDPAEDLILLVYTNVHPIPQYGEVVRKFRILVYQALVK